MLASTPFGREETVPEDLPGSDTDGVAAADEDEDGDGDGDTSTVTLEWTGWGYNCEAARLRRRGCDLRVRV